MSRPLEKMIRFEPGSVRYDRDGAVFRFNANDGLTRVPCVISQSAFEAIAHVKVDAENARHIFTDWEQAVFLAAAEQYHRADHARGSAIVMGIGPQAQAA